MPRHRACCASCSGVTSSRSRRRPPARSEAVGPAAIVIHADGIGLPGILVTGEPTLGRLVVAVRRPDDELPVAAVDVGAAGAILVAGARIDV